MSCKCSDGVRHVGEGRTGKWNVCTVGLVNLKYFLFQININVSISPTILPLKDD